MPQDATKEQQARSFVIFDVETTGFKPEEGHELLEVAAEKIHNREVVETFHALVTPLRPVPAEATAIHGITQELLQAQGRDAREVVQEFLSFAEGSILVGHNVGFDLSFINFYSEKFALPKPVNQTLDTCEIARRHLIIPSYSLERVAQYFGIVNRKAHRAQSDVEVTRKVFLALLDRVLEGKEKT